MSNEELGRARALTSPRAIGPKQIIGDEEFQALLQKGEELVAAAQAEILLRTKRRGTIVLDRETCDWVINIEADTAICRTHGEIADGPKSAHFPGVKQLKEAD